jgi:hypothetical protein
MLQGHKLQINGDLKVAATIEVMPNAETRRNRASSLFS